MFDKSEVLVKALLLYIEATDEQKNALIVSLEGRLKERDKQNEELHKINQQLQKDVDDWVKKESGKYSDYVVETTKDGLVIKGDE